jgi:hypothetical protein
MRGQSLLRNGDQPHGDFFFKETARLQRAVMLAIVCSFASHNPCRLSGPRFVDECVGAADFVTELVA